MSTAFTPFQRAQNAIAVFWLNLFPALTHIKIVEGMQEAITLDLANMPKQSRLLLAHCMERNDPEITLLADDTDVFYMFMEDWFITIPCSTIGTNCFKFKPHVWSELMSIRSEILDGDLSELDAYRKRKSAVYPWVW